MQYTLLTKGCTFLLLSRRRALRIVSGMKVNDIVVACKVLLASPDICKVFYVDIDIHHGDGVENAFLYTDKVVTLSFHMCQPGFFPNTGQTVFGTRGKTKTTVIRIPLEQGINDDMYTKTFTTVVDMLYAYHAPDALILQCGVDGACGDPLGGFNLTGAAYTTCVQHLLSYDKPTLILGGGGYNSANAARIWTDVLECCINELGTASPENGGERRWALSRDIPLEDDFFDRYGPSFSRDICTQSTEANRNTKEKLAGLVRQIQATLQPKRPADEIEKSCKKRRHMESAPSEADQSNSNS